MRGAGACPRSGLPVFGPARIDGPEVDAREIAADLASRKFIEGARPYRERFRTDGIGVFDAPYAPFNPRTARSAETDKWTAWDVVLDVWPDVFAWGVIGDSGDRRWRAASGGRRATWPQRRARDDRSARVVLQRFRLGPRRSRVHRLCAAQPVSRRGSLRWLSRKANTIRATLFSFILAQHERILDWLGSLPFVATPIALRSTV